MGNSRLVLLRLRILGLLVAIGTIPGLSRGSLQPAAKSSAPASAITLPSLDATPDGQALHTAWSAAGYRFTPTVRAAYLAFAKAQARRDLAAAGKTLPPDFLAWIDSDPIVESTVYSARIAPANILLMLRSLELDLGIETVRRKYTQLALAMAVMDANQGPTANITPHDPIKLVIPPDPRHPVDTKDPNRTLDVNDCIINFLNEHPVEDVRIEHKWAPPASALVYDSKGVAISDLQDQRDKAAALAVEKKVLRPLTAAEVMASGALQDQFNAYMTAHGQSVQIHCGDHVLYPERNDAVPGGEQGKEILEAFHLFKTAYEAKGLLPVQRDPAPTPAEACAFLIRDHECTVPPAPSKQHLPDFPLTAPWPLMNFLASDNQSLREREDIWERYHDKGQLRLYGEYTGGIAQQSDFQSARRLCPYPFTYGTFQMMCKDGGVCGTMANMQTRTYEALGIPASTAGQPEHCALIFFARDPKTSTYDCRGAQFVTAGPAGTLPHAHWRYGDVDAGKPMVYHQTIAWAVNFGFASYLDSTMAYNFFRLLPDADRKAHGQQLLESGLALNPYNFLLTDAALGLATAPAAQVHVFASLQTALAATPDKPGCPVNSLYNQTVLQQVASNLARLPVPADKQAATEIYSFLQTQKCDNPQTLAIYEVAVEGLPAMLSHAQADFTAYLAARTAATSAAMGKRLAAAAARIPDKAQRKQWTIDRLEQMHDHEAYFGPHNAIVIDSVATLLAKLSGTALRPQSELIDPLLNQLTAALTAEVSGPRDPKSCRRLADQITAAARQITDENQKRQWAQSLSRIITGHEQFTPPNARKNVKPQRDPCADAIAALAPAATTSSVQ